MTMPRVVPRVKGFFSSGFGYLSFLIAQVFALVRLLPPGHPYLLSANIGRYGFRHVIAQAAGNITFSWKHTDQIVVFVAVLTGLVLLVAQFVILMYAVFISPVLATPTITSMFDTVNPAKDVAFNLLDQIFGIPDVFCSVSAPGDCTKYSADLVADGQLLPLPFHSALHSLFEFYSTGLLMIAVFIFLYFVVVVIVETVTTGTPFGQRFQNFWVPVRLIVCLGLLMPLPPHGISSGQYIVLYTAKYASGFATNGWNAYNAGVAAHSNFQGTDQFQNGLPLGEAYNYLALPEAPDLSHLIEAMTLVHACAYAYHRLNGDYNAGNYNETKGDLSKYEDRTYNYAQPGSDEGDFEVQPFLVKTKQPGMIDDTIIMVDDVPRLRGYSEIRQYIENVNDIPYASASEMSALGFYYASDIIIRFGEYRKVGIGPVETPQHQNEVGYVKPLCGDIRIPIRDLSDVGGGAAGRGGADAMQQFYYEMVLKLWYEAPELRQVGRTLIEYHTEQNAANLNTFCSNDEAGGGYKLAAINSSVEGFVTEPQCKDSIKPSSSWRSVFINNYEVELTEKIQDAWADYVLESAHVQYDDDIIDLGWGGAGVWYNFIAEVNGGWMDGVTGVPYMERYPAVMEEVEAFKQQNVKNYDVNERYNPTIAARSEVVGPQHVTLKDGKDALNQIAIPLYHVYTFWNQPGDEKDNNEINRARQANAFVNAVNILLGTTGLVDIRTSNQYMHPMAQLVAVGKGLVDSAVLNMAGATTGAFMGGMMGALNQFKGIAGLVDAASQMFYSVAFLGLTAGFVLYYVLPFMPFLYFFFSLANWVKAIFEAMLGVPLWALAHMRIDGEGLPGDAAANGYFLILEIFVRPILTVIGLLASIVIFATQVRIMNIIWDLVTANAAGFSAASNIVQAPADNDIMFFRSRVDEFFFTLIYTIVAYMMAMSSFKLIDKIPDNILRWAGAGVSSYGDIDQDNVESLSRYAAMGGMTIGNQAAGAVVQLGKGLGGQVGGVVRDATSSPAPSPVNVPGRGR
ncbi:MAG: DotA/TraY family protein [Alphaproteobacteria bacterium]